MPLAPVGTFSATREETLRHVAEDQIALISCGSRTCNGFNVRGANNSSWSYTEPMLDHDLTSLGWLADGRTLVASRHHTTGKETRTDNPKEQFPQWRRVI